MLATLKGGSAPGVPLPTEKDKKKPKKKKPKG